MKHNSWSTPVRPKMPTPAGEKRKRERAQKQVSAAGKEKRRKGKRMDEEKKRREGGVSIGRVRVPSAGSC